MITQELTVKSEVKNEACFSAKLFASLALSVSFCSYFRGFTSAQELGEKEEGKSSFQSVSSLAEAPQGIETLSFTYQCCISNKQSLAWCSFWSR